MKDRKSRILSLAALMSTLTVLPGRAVSGDFDQWYYERLMNPGQHQLAMETSGRVFIYDGMREADVDAALDTQFERIDSMMFVRTIRLADSGETVQDDDCD